MIMWNYYSAICVYLIVESHRKSKKLHSKEIEHIAFKRITKLYCVNSSQMTMITNTNPTNIYLKAIYWWAFASVTWDNRSWDHNDQCRRVPTFRSPTLSVKWTEHDFLAVGPWEGWFMCLKRLKWSIHVGLWVN